MSYSRGGWVGAHLVGQADQVVGGLAHGAHHDDHVGPCAAGPGHVVGHGPDPVGVADRGPTELLDDQRHPAEATDCATGAGPPPPPRRPAPAARPAPRRPGDRRPPGGSGRVSGRAQREDEPASAPAERPGWRPRPSGSKRRQRIRNGIIVVVVAGVVVGIAFARLGDEQQAGGIASPSVEHDHHDGRHDTARRQRSRPQANAVAVRPGCPASTKTRVNDQTYPAAPGHDHRHVEDLHGHGQDDAGTFVITLDAKTAPDHGQQLRLPGPPGLLQLRHLPPGHPRLHGPDR